MKIAVSTADGISICGHLGHCSTFFIYSVEGNSIVSKELRQVTPVHSGSHNDHAHGEHGNHHEHESHHGDQGAHHHADHHGGLVGSLSDCATVITNGMGGGMIAALTNAGIDPVITGETDPDVAVAAYLAGALQRSSHGCRNCGGHH